MTDKLNKLIYSLKLPELRPMWWGGVGFLALLAIDVIYLREALWFWVSAALLAALAVFLGIAEYKLALSNLNKRIAYGRLESIVAHLEDAVIAYDSQFKILFFNSAAEKIFGISSARALGRVLGPEKVNDSELRLLVQTLFPSLAPTVITHSEPGQFPQVVDISFDQPNREFRVYTDRVSDANNYLLGFVKVVRDRTREMQLIKSKSEFITIAAHQLRTPLTTINWSLEGLAKNPSLDKEGRDLAQGGLQATANLLRTVNDLLNIAEIEEGHFGYQMTNFDFIQFINEVLDNARSFAKKYGLEVYFDRGGLDKLEVRADKNKLGIALSNVLDNAVKYNSPKGSIVLRLKQLSDKPYVQVSIQDTGIGIPPGDMDKVFTKFHRAENAKRVHASGSGLGLSLVKNIIIQHGGTIWLESALGRGTTVYFTLPTDPNLIPKTEIISAASE